MKDLNIEKFEEEIQKVIENYSVADLMDATPQEANEYVLKIFGNILILYPCLIDVFEAGIWDFLDNGKYVYNETQKTELCAEVMRVFIMTIKVLSECNEVEVEK